MKTLLRIDASLRTTGSYSRKLASHFEKQWRQHFPEGDVIYRDLAVEPIPHLSQEMVEAFFEAGDSVAPETKMSDILIQELKQADHLVIVSPLYNLSLSSSLKAYFDHVVRSGHTFHFDGAGYNGLLMEKKAVVITSRGGFSSDFQDDFQRGYLKAILAFVGISSLYEVDMVGTAVDDGKSERFAAAKQTIEEYFINSPGFEIVGELSPEDCRQISALRNGQERAIVNGDANAYARLCTSDIRLMVPGHDCVIGQADFLEVERALFEKAQFKSFQKFPERLERSGNIAVETGKQEITMKNSTHHKGVYSSKQKYMHVFRLDGQEWRYAVLMSNPSGLSHV